MAFRGRSKYGDCLKCGKKGVFIYGGKWNKNKCVYCKDISEVGK